jgi:hypothetical protein
MKRKEEAIKNGKDTPRSSSRIKEAKKMKKDEKHEPHTPGDSIQIDPNQQPLPTRDPKTKMLHFQDHPNFKPNLTPAEIIQRGSFGGTYFRPIKSKVTNQSYMDAWKEFPKEWFSGLNIQSFASKTYNKDVNFYGVSCGGDLDMCM